MNNDDERDREEEAHNAQLLRDDVEVTTDPPIDEIEAERRGYTVDRHCYPWVAYKGPRFTPDEVIEIDTPAWPIRTRTGKVLTDDDFERLADEAERGYSVEGLRDRPSRRPLPFLQAMQRHGSIVADVFLRDRDERFRAANDQTWGAGNWIRCFRCVDSLGYPAYHHKDHHGIHR